tara:strand:- start:1442 stop:2467 length:1026 start_codon:yes stop_codon:yes gene_type:complete
VSECLVEVYRGDLVESNHFGHVVISNNIGKVLAYWGNPTTIIYPRSSCKIIQALPLVEMGLERDFSLTDKHLALACASHSGGEIHLNVAKDWLQKIKLDEKDLLCGSHLPYDKIELQKIKINNEKPSQLHNNCSGKHLGFLTIAKAISKNIDYKKDYIDVDHTVQKIVKKTFEDITGFQNPDYALDGCSAPNFACSIQSLAKAMAVFANPENLQKNRIMSMKKLRNAVLNFPELTAGSDRLCTKIMKKSNGRLIVKVGAEGVYTAMLLDKGLGMALKICDGSKRAAECLIVTLLVMLGYFNKDDEDFLNYLNTPIYNWSEKKTGIIRASDTVWAKGNFLDI